MLTSIAQTEQEIASAENKLKNGEHEECIQLLSSAINTVPQLPKLRLLRARCHIAKGEIEEAAGDFSRAAYINPSDRELLITLATMNYYSLYEPQVALAHIKQCLHYDPEDKACKALFRKLKKYEKDVSKVDEDLVKKRFATAVNKLVGSGERIGLITEVDEEVNVMEKEMNAVGKMPKRLQLKLYKMACRIYSEQKDTKNTLKWCDKTLKIDENDTDALMSRGEMYLNDELYEEAVRELNKANESVGGQNQQVKELLNKAQRLLKQSQTKDYYKILGVTRQADKREIRKAYRKLAQIWHPDKYTGDLDSDAVEKKMSDINQAYEVLKMRAQFDNGEDPFDSSANQSPFGHGGHPFGGHPFGGHPFGGGQFPQGFQFEFKF
ncbi:hypothetical protein BC937DRAFT_91071 [Endogone sp. FLAS-F59071]|nr:hypothetical protein BC937DRAFT_91071 [Endogone sp. FLAS-F59071]|eukprot:RUS16563.1 hypothetical protein BC937DRAFT_91071 [Endogone sp. FLAS-F59071]